MHDLKIIDDLIHRLSALPYLIPYIHLYDLVVILPLVYSHSSYWKVEEGPIGWFTASIRSPCVLGHRPLYSFSYA